MKMHGGVGWVVVCIELCSGVHALVPNFGCNKEGFNFRH